MQLNKQGRPNLAPKTVADSVRSQYGIEGMINPLPAEWDQNFLLDAGDEGRFVVKIANQGWDSAKLEFQNAILKWLSEFWIPGKTPTVVLTLSKKRIGSIISSAGEPYKIRLLTYLDGQPVAETGTLDGVSLERLGYTLGDLDRCLLEFQHPAMEYDSPWDLRQAEWISSQTGRIQDIRRRGIVERLLLQHQGRVKPVLPDLPMSVIHNDANDENVLLERNAEGWWDVAGLVDFGDALRSHTVNELAILCTYTILRMDEPLEVIAQIASGYHRARALSEEEIQVLFPLTCMRLCVSVTNSAIAAQEDPHNKHRQISDTLAWEALERIAGIDWREAETRFRKACGLEARPETRFGMEQWSVETLVSERKKLIGPSLSLFYKTPLEIMRGRGQFLFDSKGRTYLDCVNNVCHVGHCHPKVVAALARQAAELNTNTRYLHPNLVEFAERLTATLPEPLKVCYFVNSGSEANELAVRLAQTHTGRRDAIVLEGGYHGSTQTLIELSPYKSEGPGGRGLPDWVHKVVKPDPYRGPYRGMAGTSGRAYAQHVREACERLVEEGRPPALFLCEPILGCGGQIVPPDGFLKHAFKHVRAFGGVCVVDEVQVGLGRVGSHMWAFETQNVIPDIVTIGKPVGNGHPLGVVVTTPQIARSFDNGMEFFSTFGGNPVSMAVGLAVLDIIEEEHLLERAARVGDYLTKGFHKLAVRHKEIGDVRGLGLFIGVEMVQDRDTRTPATGMTTKLIERLKKDGILLSAEGPDHNILKIKPPLPFSETDADLLLGAVDRALLEMRVSRNACDPG